MTPEQFATTAGGGALGVVAIYLCRIVLQLIRDKSTPPVPPTQNLPKSSRRITPDLMARTDHNTLARVYSEIENSKKDRERIIKMLAKCHEMMKELHEMHDQKDEDGVLRWLNKPSIEREIKRIGRMLDDMRKRGGRSGEYSINQKKD